MSIGLQSLHSYCKVYICIIFLNGIVGWEISRPFRTIIWMPHLIDNLPVGLVQLLNYFCSKYFIQQLVPNTFFHRFESVCLPPPAAPAR